jgi:glycosyltransferase involved in cell wall biosynthesis
MRVLVSVEHRFYRTPDGAIWTPTNHAYSFWTRYLKVFEGVRVLARVRGVSNPPARGHRADGPGVSFAPVPSYIGPLQYLVRARAVNRALRVAIQPDEAVIMRVSSHLANCLEPYLLSTAHPFGLEVIGDPYEVFSPGAVSHPLRALLRWWFPRRLRAQCSAAAGVAYVTQRSLQKAYPCRGYKDGLSDVELDDAAIIQGKKAFATSYSSVELDQVQTAQPSQRSASAQSSFRLISVASLAQMYKGVDVLIRALAVCRRRRLDVRLTIVGDGKCRPVLERLAARLGVTAFIEFRGHVASGVEIRNELDRSDLFVLPSKTEGLPRALIEAMARALPCIGSAVGGIPELLAAENLAPPGDVQALARKIEEVVSSPRRMAEMSVSNLKRSEEFRQDVLDARRKTFYEYVKEVTKQWIEARAC